MGSYASELPPSVLGHRIDVCLFTDGTMWSNVAHRQTSEDLLPPVQLVKLQYHMKRVCFIIVVQSYLWRDISISEIDFCLANDTPRSKKRRHRFWIPWCTCLLERKHSGPDGTASDLRML